MAWCTRRSSLDRIEGIESWRASVCARSPSLELTKRVLLCPKLVVLLEDHTSLAVLNRGALGREELERALSRRLGAGAGRDGSCYDSCDGLFELVEVVGGRLLLLLCVREVVLEPVVVVHRGESGRGTAHTAGRVGRV